MTIFDHLNKISEKCLYRLSTASPINDYEVAACRSTIEAINMLILLADVELSPCNGGSCAVATEADDKLDRVKARINNILAAWPEELLK